VVVDDAALLGGRETTPGATAGHGSRAGRQLGPQLVDVPGPAAALVSLGVEPRVVDLQEHPLGPAVEVDVGGRGRAPVVVRETQPAQLTAHVRDVRLGGGPRVRSGLDRVLLGGQAEGVVAQGVQHVATTHPLEPAVDVGRDVPQRVTDVQARAAGVGEHVQDVELLSTGDLLGVGPGARRVRRPEGALAVPAVLPLLLDPSGQVSGVAVRRLIGLAGPDGRARLLAHVVPSGRPTRHGARGCCVVPGDRDAHASGQSARAALTRAGPGWADTARRSARPAKKHVGPHRARLAQGGLSPASRRGGAGVGAAGSARAGSAGTPERPPRGAGRAVGASRGRRGAASCRRCRRPTARAPTRRR